MLNEKLSNLYIAAKIIRSAVFLFASLALGLTAFSQSATSKLIRQVGINGHWKLGHSCNVRVDIPKSLQNQVEAVVITSLDGDGTEVQYRLKLHFPAEDSMVDVPIRIGQLKSMISASLIDSQGKVVATEDLDLSNTTGLSATQPMIICLGESMGLDELVRVSVDQLQQSLSIVPVHNGQFLPSTWLAYQPCNLVVVSTSNVELLRAIQPEQWQALDQWIRRGGACILTLGSSAADIRSVNQLQQLLPGNIVADADIRSPAALESMMNSEQQLQPFPAIHIAAQRGQVKLSLKNSVSQQIPWWINTAHGHGSIQVIASDLDHDAFANWKQRKALWERLVSSTIDKSLIDGSQSEHTATTSYLGYSDLTGQLRSSLDLFQGVSSVGFSQVAGVLLCILLLIGPLDYFVSVKWLKRPDLSWPFAGVMLLVSSAALTWYYQQLRPDQVITNSVQLVDIDTKTGQVDGHLWSHIYSAHARPLSVLANNPSDPTSVLLDWQGLPGKGLGGLQSQLTIASGMPSYTIDVRPDGSSQIQRVGIPAAGTKSLYGTYSKASHISNASSLREISTIDQLEGELVNPLDVDLKDVSLFYHRWFYSLSSRLAAGQRFKLSSQVIPKDLVRRLNKQQDIDGKTTSVRWSPGERNEIDRLLELMMFHNAATGQNYTALTHHYQPIVDHSHLLESDSAILIGRLDSSPIQLKVEPAQTADQPKIVAAIDRAWCRILIPVSSNSARGMTN